MTRNKVTQIILALALVAALAIRGFYVKNPILAGGTMGTGYSVTLSGYVSRNSLDELQRQIESELAEINRQMSTWDAKSEISTFNQSDESGPFEISVAFTEVIEQALKLSKSTGGAFDPTLQPLLNLWGFGSEGHERKVPSDANIAAAKEKTGADKVWINKSAQLWKAAPEVQLALGAIAKGHGVDTIARLLDKTGHKNWFVEIGGEVVVRGRNPKEKPWRVGIQHPSSNPAVDKLHGIVNLTEGAVATSGDYRNYIEQNGVLHSHILDPRSGRAVLSDTASVTVVAPSCMDADGMATALFVMGADEGLAWVEDRPEVEAMFLLRGTDGKIIEKFSSGFTVATSYVPASEN
ncbi:MAG: FAD:protein FMN transferase [Verrucomicrobiota bacterium]